VSQKANQEPGQRYRPKGSICESQVSSSRPVRSLEAKQGSFVLFGGGQFRRVSARPAIFDPPSRLTVQLTACLSVFPSFSHLSLIQLGRPVFVASQSYRRIQSDRPPVVVPVESAWALRSSRTRARARISYIPSSHPSADHHPQIGFSPSVVAKTTSIPTSPNQKTCGERYIARRVLLHLPRPSSPTSKVEVETSDEQAGKVGSRRRQTRGN
jgi:hypothetical protein